MQVSIITPERILFRDTHAKRVTLPTADGEITVLPDHIPLVTFLKAGEIIVEDDKETIPMAISGGFLEVSGNKIKILADTAERVEELDMERAEEARKRAQDLLEHKRESGVDFAALTAKIEKETARIRFGKKYKKLNIKN